MEMEQASAAIDAVAGPAEPHRSHDPENNAKRSDPFQFGNRMLEAEDNVFEFNAWDHVAPDETHLAYCEEQYAKQRAAPVSDFDKDRFNRQPEKWWDLFYKQKTSTFFKDRKWLQQEFPILSEVTQPHAGKKVVLEVGAGAGNTAFPVLRQNQNPELMIHACDFSKTAVETMRQSPDYHEQNMVANVWDVASSPNEENDGLPPGLSEGSVDVVIMIFIFSALSPSQWNQTVHNIHKLLKPGGSVLFRDYGKGDLAQVRMKSGRYLDENFYVRGDGTRVYFFELEELRQIWSAVPMEVQGSSTNGISQDTSMPMFHIENLDIDRRLIVNRQHKIKMYRAWIQGRFTKRERG